MREIEHYAEGNHKFLNPVREIRSCLKVIAELQEKINILQQLRRVK
jgi:hypothetical protein